MGKIILRAGQFGWCLARNQTPGKLLIRSVKIKVQLMLAKKQKWFLCSGDLECLPETVLHSLI